MNGLAPSSAAPPRSRAQLRLLDGHLAAPQTSLRLERPIGVDLVVPPEPGHVLIAGADSRARAHMRCELRDVLPSATRFVETDETWEALTLAERSQMVVLVGDLKDLAGSSVVHLLARRQPALPVLAVAGEAPPALQDAANG